jgi:glycine oxidase
LGKALQDPSLSLSLVKAGYTVTVINQPITYHQAQRVAGGIWNPIVFKRLTKSWMADDISARAHFRFMSIGKNNSYTSLIQKREIIKPFTEEQEKNLMGQKIFR